MYPNLETNILNLAWPVSVAIASRSTGRRRGSAFQPNSLARAKRTLEEDCQAGPMHIC